jgi:segregation and condensation protein A
MPAEAAHPESVACRVTLGEFEGPLDLLLYLIRRDEMDITLVMVSQVARQYLDYIRGALELNIDVAGEYLVMAATLTRMKSRSLLPSRRGNQEDPGDPGNALLRQLILYRAFREAASELRESEEAWRDAFPPPGERDRFQDSRREAAGRDTGSILDLLEALEALARKNQPDRPQMIERPVLSIAECIEGLSLALQGGRRISFGKLLGKTRDRHRVVSFFVAVLELVRRGWVRCRQEGSFGGITLERTKKWA